MRNAALGQHIQIYVSTQDLKKMTMITIVRKVYKKSIRSTYSNSCVSISLADTLNMKSSIRSTYSNSCLCLMLSRHF